MLQVMWYTALNTITRRRSLLSELVVRSALMLTFCLMNLTVAPHERAFSEAQLLAYCKPRRDSCVPTWLMICIVVCVPLLLFFLPRLLARNDVDTTQALLGWSLAMSINIVITEMLKLFVGRPRPDYFYRCFPNGRITKELRCTGKIKDIVDGRKSFPSGHSSFSFCSLGFLSIWLCGRLGVLSRNVENRKNVVWCIVPLLIASLIAVSRFWDHHHHWEDILAGSVLGLISSYICYRQYYHPLDSDLSGIPNNMTSLYMTSSEIPSNEVYFSVNNVCTILHLRHNLKFE